MFQFGLVSVRSYPYVSFELWENAGETYFRFSICLSALGVAAYGQVPGRKLNQRKLGISETVQSRESSGLG